MYLDTDETRLYYEVYGSGRPLLLIHGVVVDAALYEEAAKLLGQYYQVIIYDRRGNSRSIPVQVQEYGIEAQVRDAKAVLDALDIQEVFLAGASAGGIVAQEVYRTYPERVSHLFLYEPPMVPLLEEQETERKWVEDIESYIERGKINRAMMEFMLSLGEIDERKQPRPQEVEEREIGNFRNFLENEFHVFMHYIPELEFYRAHAEHITVAIGEHSGESKYVRAARRFQKLIGSELLHFPGCHNLPSDLPLDFCTCLMGVMTYHGYFPNK